MTNTELVTLAGIIKMAQEPVQAPAWAANAKPTPIVQGGVTESGRLNFHNERDVNVARAARAPAHAQVDLGGPYGATWRGEQAFMNSPRDQRPGPGLRTSLGEYDSLRKDKTPAEAFKFMQAPLPSGGGLPREHMEAIRDLIERGIITAGGPGQGPTQG